MIPDEFNLGGLGPTPLTSTTQVSIRPAREADLEAITAIYRYHVEHGTSSFELEAPGLEEMRRRHADLLSHGFPYLVAEAGDVVLGYAYAGPYRARAAYCDTVENSVYLRPDAIRNGTGRQLLQALVGACEACGFRQMIAVIGITDSPASFLLHERCGFRRVGVLENVGYKNGQWLDRVLMQLPLGAGHTAPPQQRRC